MRLFGFDIGPPEVLESLLALLICTLLIVRCVMLLFAPERKTWSTRRYALEGFFWFIGVLIAAFGAADLHRFAIDRIDRSVMESVTIVSAFGILLFSAVALAALLGEKILARRSVWAARTAYLALLIGCAYWFASRTNESFELTFEQEAMLSQSMDVMREASEYLAITDAGEQVPLYEIDMRDRDEGTRNFLAKSATTPEGAKVIPRADANINANCHGWIFTGGKHLLRGNGVDVILRDNGYKIQGKPEAGDLIIYRNEMGEVLHTGLVSGILLDGTCIIESKWGIAGRFLHQAEDQPYGLNYSFYRSDRGSHLVTIIHRSQLNSFLTTLSPRERVTPGEPPQSFKPTPDLPAAK